MARSDDSRQDPATRQDAKKDFLILFHYHKGILSAFVYRW
jgi:hypothetical protein